MPPSCGWIRRWPQTPRAGFREAVPAFVNLLVEFDPQTTDHATVTAHLCRLLTTQTTTRPEATEREVLVCYDPALSPDIVAVAQQTGLTAEAVINTHLSCKRNLVGDSVKENPGQQ